MANIKVNDLTVPDLNGNELFEDSESFLSELTDAELTMNKGGSTPLCVTGVVALVTILTPNDAY